MKKNILLSLLLSMAVSIFAETLSVESVNTRALKGLLNSLHLEDSKIDEDNNLVLRKSGINIVIETDENRKMLKMWAVWKTSENISENRVNRLLNTWNKDKIFVTAYGSKEKNLIYLEYWLCYNGGISSENFNASITWFFKIADAFGEYCKEEDIFE